jgi:WD40 repeat protein
VLVVALGGLGGPPLVGVERAGDWSCLHILTGHTNVVWACVWAPDGSSLVTTSHDHTVRVWSTRDYNSLARLSELVKASITRADIAARAASS